MVSTTTFLFRFFLITLLLLLIDYYAFQGILSASASLPELWKHGTGYTYWIAGVTLLLAVIFGFWAARSGYIGFSSAMKIAGLLFTLLVAKLVLILFLLSEDIWRITLWIWQWIHASLTDSVEAVFFAPRKALISRIGLVVAAVPLAGMVYGMIRGKYDFQVRREEIHYPDLPDAFDGFTITQISDLHSGSFDDREAVLKGLRMVEHLQSDLLVFTGDLVNNTADEIEPWITDLARLTAPFGKFSILGNHDYGDYVPWESPEAKAKNFLTLHEHHRSMGFRLLMNEHIPIRKDGHELSLIGVENWGVGFHQKGDLKTALSDVDPGAFKLLLSHDPSHWEAEVMGHDHHIHLTLSGHTHGMQFGVEIGKFKWSPVKYRYGRWAGLYSESGRYLYINRGFGFIGFPGRVGIWPEITQIVLRKKK
ncbi:MAG: metallophosphoesterase [Bacteroidia bacterium]|nr:metallophosphoesterase [Bacteroidia bacterium]